MSLEKQLANTDSIYCTDRVNSNQTGIFLSNLGVPELDVLFGSNYQSNDTVRLRLSKRNLAFNAVAHVIDGKTWYKRNSNETWPINRKWLNDKLEILENAFSNENEVFLASLNKDEKNTRRLYLKGLTSLNRSDWKKTISLRDFLFSNDVIVLTKLDNGDISLDVKIPDNPIVDYKPKKVFPVEQNEQDNPFQLIIWGAPGTGKSYALEMKSEVFDGQHKERVTFYPTYTYQQFVGTYKPFVEKDSEGKNQITYSYVPGPFLRLLTKAYQHPDENYLLVIEELNRSNVAAVFGDAFQLLDRKEDGTSEYPIAISEDMKNYFTDQEMAIDELILPSNFHIWATMNSADQGVFPIDTAFKRRWDFEYLDIDTNESIIADYSFSFKDGVYFWNDIRKAINKKMLSAKVNEDKLLGPFFIKHETIVAGNDVLFLETFKSKVLMYLFEDAVRHNRQAIFKGNNGLLSFSDICHRFDSEGLLAVLNIEIDRVQDNEISKDDTENSEQ